MSAPISSCPEIQIRTKVTDLLCPSAIVFIGCGLLYLTFSQTQNWAAERRGFRAWPPLVAFWVASLLFVNITPFFQNTTVTPAIPWYVLPTVGSSILVLGPLYWFGWARVWPLFGYAIEHQVEQLPDGSEVVRYMVSPLFSIPWRYIETAELMRSSMFGDERAWRQRNPVGGQLKERALKGLFPGKCLSFRPAFFMHGAHKTTVCCRIDCGRGPYRNESATC